MSDLESVGHKTLKIWLKKERINLPVNTHKLASLIQTDEKEQLALASKQLRKLSPNHDTSPQ